jgi:pyrroline-5-carboxylate reductase
MIVKQKLLLVGCGKMGSALLAGWLGRDIDDIDVAVVEPSTKDFLENGFNVPVVNSLDKLNVEFKPNIIVFAVKPQAMDQIVPNYGHFVGPKTMFLSIAAGKPTEYFQHRLGNGAAVVRSMPNTPAAVGRGITVAYRNDAVTNAQKLIATKLLGAVGEVGWVEDESLIDGVTAISGSGPAYVFLMIECLAQAGARVGLAPDLAAQLALATVAGSGELARQSTDNASVLRQNVTSPGGTTAAALDVLMGENGLQELISQAVLAAEKRSRELSS